MFIWKQDLSEICNVRLLKNFECIDFIPHWYNIKAAELRENSPVKSCSTYHV